MTRLSNTIYPITYIGGTLGSSLGFFLSMHDGFYMTSPEIELTPNGEVARHLEGILRISHTPELINQELAKYPKNKKVVCSVNSNRRIPSCDYKLDHRMYPKELLDLLGKDVFPVIVKAEDDVLNFANARIGVNFQDKNQLSIRLLDERRKKIEMRSIERKLDPNILHNTVNQLSCIGQDQKDFLLLDILKIYRDLDEFEYKKLCDFAKVPTRHDWKHTVENLARLVNLYEFL
jgi:hypothetical protein